MLFNNIKAKIPEEFKQRVKQIITTSHDPKWERFASTGKRRIFIFLAGFYQNLGDMAITYAQVEFLHELHPDAEIICVPSDQTYSSIKTIKKYVSLEDLITITGGGNMDDHYSSLENARLFVVKSFPNNKIVSFPQTICFSDSIQGQKKLEKSRRVYEHHNNIVIFAREKASFERARMCFRSTNIELCPDIVLSLKLTFQEKDRDGTGVCLRNDMESSISAESRYKLTQVFQKIHHSVDSIDTINVEKRDCQPDRYENTVMSFLNKIRGYQLILTDRLHCMIFCAITDTPCIAIDNSNHKISGVYSEWLKDINFIQFVQQSDLGIIGSTAMELSRLKVIQPVNLKKEFEPLVKVIK